MTILATGVTKVSGKAADTSGEVVLTAADVGAVPTKGALIRLDDGIVSGWPNNTNGSPDNYINRSIIRLSDTHGTLSFFGDDTTNSYRLGVQSSNPSPNFTSVVGTFELNPHGGAVKINGYTAYHSGNVVGSGGIIERGSNSNGEYVKFADGTMICALSGDRAWPVTAAYGASGLHQSRHTWNFPASFLSIPSVTCGGATWGTSASWSAVAGSPTISFAQLRFVDIDTRAAATIYTMATAIGRWK